MLRRYDTKANGYLDIEDLENLLGGPRPADIPTEGETPDWGYVQEFL
jgi:hypothetical protein